MKQSNNMEGNKMADLISPSRVSPIETRRSTDKFFILLIPLNLLLWLGIVSYELLSDVHDNPRTRYSAYYFYLMLKRYFQNFFIFGATAVLVIILFLYTLTKLRDNWVVYVVKSFIVTISLILIAFIFWQICLNIRSNTNFLLLILITTALYLLYLATIFICTNEVGASALGPMIKEPLRAITNCLVVSLFSLAIICLLAIIFINTTIVMFVMTRPTENPMFFIWMRVGLFAVAGMYIFNFIWNFGFMVMGDYFVHYYGVDENHTLSKAYVIQSINRVVRYHFGTIAFLSMPIFPSICALVVAYKNDHQNQQSGYKLINFISKICLIADISTYTLIQTSIYGCKSLTSITKMFDVRGRNSLLFVTLHAIHFRIVEISVIIAIIVGTIVQISFGFLDCDHFLRIEYYLLTWENFTDTVMTDIGLAIVYAKFIAMFLIRPAACAFSICKMISRREYGVPESQPPLTEQ